MTDLIGVCGEAGSGKDYFAGELDRRGHPVHVVKFATHLRRDIEATLEIDEIPVLWAKPTPPAIRSLLQWWGDFRRAQDENYFVELTMKEIDDIVATHVRLDVGQVCLYDRPLIVVTDVRYENEARAIRDRGGVIVRVWASEHTRRLRTGEVPHHATEVIDFEADWNVHNDINGQRPQLPNGLTDHL